MYFIYIALLLYFKFVWSNDIPVISSQLEVMMYDNSEIEFQLKSRNNLTEEIRPTSTLSLRNNFKSGEDIKFYENASVPLIASIYLYDKAVVDILRNVTLDGKSARNITSFLRNLINRYIREWYDLIHDPKSEDFYTFEDHPFPDFETPKVNLPKEMEKMFKILCMNIRTQTYLPIIIKLLENFSLSGVVHEIEKAEMRSEYFSTFEDIKEAAFSVLKLSEMYFTHPRELFAEELAKISIQDLIHVSLSTSDIQSLIESLKWILFAEEHFLDQASHNSLKNQNEEETNENLYATQDEGQIKEKENQENLNVTHTYIQIIKNILSYNYDVISKNSEAINISKPISKSSEEEISKLRLKFRTQRQKETLGSVYKALCNGIDLRSHLETSKLTCLYDDLGTPWFYIMPVKVEILSKDFQVIFFHNVLSESKIKKLQHLALPLQRTSVVGNEVVDTLIRSSFVTFIDDIIPEIIDINKITSYLTGLEAVKEEDAEIIQVNSYKPGGHYTPHFDSSGLDLHSGFEDEELKRHTDKFRNGERIATLMYYLNDVEFGGRTVFTKLGLTVAPEKGGALFWFSLFNSGRTDIRGEHAGCPLIEGIKWVANKWIHYNSQWKKRPCELVQENINQNQAV